MDVTRVAVLVALNWDRLLTSNSNAQQPSTLPLADTLAQTSTPSPTVLSSRRALRPSAALQSPWPARPARMQVQTRDVLIAHSQ